VEKISLQENNVEENNIEENSMEAKNMNSNDSTATGIGAKTGGAHRTEAHGMDRTSEGRSSGAPEGAARTALPRIEQPDARAAVGPASATMAPPADGVDALRQRLRHRITIGSFPTAAAALPPVEYRVASLRALATVGSAAIDDDFARLDTSRDPASDLRRDAGESDASHDASPGTLPPGHRGESGGQSPVGSPAETPGEARERLAGRGRKPPQFLQLDGERVVTTPRFWWSLFTRCGLNEAVFRYFEPAEVFNRVARLDAGRSVRFAIETPAPRTDGSPRPRRLLAVSSPSGPLLGRDHAAEIVDMHGGHGFAYSDGVLSSMHLPARGDRVTTIGPDEFKERFHLEVPVDGLGEPRIHIALLRLVCQNGAIGLRSLFRSAIRLGKDPEHSLERALGHYSNDDGFSAMRQRFVSAQRSWASLREVRLLERELDRISWGVTDGVAQRRRAFRQMVGDYESRYGLASIDAVSVKRQRMLQAGCRMYDLINFATEIASHHAPPAAAVRLQGWLGTAIADEYDLENTADDVPEFVDVFTSVPASGPFGGRLGNN